MATQSNTSLNRTLERELKTRLRGKFLSDKMTRILYSTDASSYQIEPLGVILPKNTEDVVSTVQVVSAQGVSIIPRGGGTSLSGQGIGEGIILDLTPHLNQILEINPAEKWARVQAGVLLDQLNAAVKPHGLMIGPDPSSSAASTLGGMIANNSTGSHSTRYGMMIDHVLEVEVVLSDGSQAHFKPRTEKEVAELAQQKTLEGKLYREIPSLLQRYEKAIDIGYPKTWRNVAGYNLKRFLEEKRAGKPFNLSPLIVSSEGTLAIILSAKLNLVQRPKYSNLVLLFLETLQEALEIVPDILTHKPGAVELVDRYFIDLTRQHAGYRDRLDFVHGNPGAILITEFTGDTQEELQQQSEALVTALTANGFSGEIVQRSQPAQIAEVWEVRKAGLGLLLSMRGDAKPLSFIDDAAVPVEHLAEYAEKVVRICRDAGTEAAFYAHASAGCLHINPLINLKTEKGIEQLHTISQRVIELAVSYGGTSTGEHGEGLARSYYNEKVYGKELHQAFRELKNLFDPGNIFNPGKIVEASEPWDPKILRFYPGYQTPQTIRETILDFSPDGGFSGLVEMCSGQGYCRKIENGVMCPSFMVTRDETYSTRGRANALRAAMTGELGTDGMSDPQLYDIMDLCLACKGCKQECPSLVDMAKLKYEFLSHYQEKHGVPLRSRIFGHIATINKIGSIFPALSNAVMNNKLFRVILELLIGIDRRRSLPRFAPVTFQKWFWRRSRTVTASRGKVIFWDDTFMSYNEPEIGQAAVRVLEAAGFEVLVLKERKCCGRPMVSKGLLKDARRNARYNVDLLLPYVRKDIPVVGVEPGCITMFRDEYIDLLRDNTAREVAKHCFLIGEFLTGLAEKGDLHLQWKNSQTPQKILVHGHCYQKAGGGTKPTLDLLRLIPKTAVEEIDSGCCGMAGAFGYEKEHYEFSMKVGEERLFTVVRNAADNSCVAAAGTSCRHQIRDGTGRKAEHPIVVLANALDIPTET